MTNLTADAKGGFTNLQIQVSTGKNISGCATWRDLFLKIFEELRFCHPDGARTTLRVTEGRRVRVEGFRGSFFRHADSRSAVENAG